MASDDPMRCPTERDILLESLSEGVQARKHSSEQHIILAWGSAAARKEQDGKAEAQSAPGFRGDGERRVILEIDPCLVDAGADGMPGAAGAFRVGPKHGNPK